MSKKTVGLMIGLTVVAFLFTTVFAAGGLETIQVARNKSFKDFVPYLLEQYDLNREQLLKLVIRNKK